MLINRGVDLFRFVSFRSSVCGWCGGWLLLLFSAKREEDKVDGLAAVVKWVGEARWWGKQSPGSHGFCLHGGGPLKTDEKWQYIAFNVSLLNGKFCWKEIKQFKEIWKWAWARVLLRVGHRDVIRFLRFTNFLLPSIVWCMAGGFSPPRHCLNRCPPAIGLFRHICMKTEQSMLEHEQHTDRQNDDGYYNFKF